ncbi:MAG: hypothetical protein KF812_08455 [Fimbriimonadaceae bacterium]|nr:hypothetical protein [Fimbriimonadaceae bacterium]
MIVLALLAAVTNFGETELVLTGLDPIELIAGREVAGKEEFSADYLRHHYRFVSAANRDAFLANTVRFAVQNGGACGSMGAMSGKGTPDRFAVVEGRIFLFASDGCRNSVVSNPAAYTAPLPAVPIATTSESSRAKSMINRAIAAHGGEAVRRMRSVSWGRATPYEDQGQPKIWWSRYAILGPQKFAKWEQSPTDRYYFVKYGSAAVDGGREGNYGVHPGEVRALTALCARNPMGVLMGLSEPVKVTEDGNGVVMVRDDIVFEVRFDRVGRIQNVRYRDYIAGPIGTVERDYGNYKSVNGVSLPMSSRSRLNGGEWGSSQIFDEVIVNGPVPSVFREAFTN